METKAAPPPAATSYPVSLELPYEIQRNRFTAFFRLLIVIPWIVVAYVYATLAMFSALFAWFAMLVTGNYPRLLYRVNAGFIRFSARFTAFASLATDELPPLWGGEHLDRRVAVAVAGPQAQYSRWKTFFKLVLAFPQFVLSYGTQLLVGGAAFISWWRILFTGKQSATMHDAMRVGITYNQRSSAFLFLMTETRPRLLDLTPMQYPPGAPGLPTPEQAPVSI